MLPFGIASVALDVAQSATVALPGRGWPARLPRPRGWGWAAIAPGSIAVVVGAITFDATVARGLTYLALVAIPPLAGAALGWAMRGARGAYAGGAVALLALAYALNGSFTGDLAALLLTSLSVVTLGRLIAGLTPATLIKAGLVITAVIDAYLILSERLQAPNAALNAAAPALGLPKLQFITIAGASMGYGDLFVAGLLGGVLALESTRRQLAGTAIVLIVGVAMNFLFYVLDSLPATVPIAVAVLVLEGWAWLGRRRPTGRGLAPRPAASGGDPGEP